MTIRGEIMLGESNEDTLLASIIVSPESQSISIC